MILPLFSGHGASAVVTRLADADVVDDVGNPVRGAVGELIIRQPWIGMTRGFGHDRQRRRRAVVPAGPQ